MGGGLVQLVAYGAQDIYLTGNPQITFFKVVYRRHTNFAMESIEQSYNGTVNFGSKFNVNITRSGDLVGPMTLEVDVGLNLEGMQHVSKNFIILDICLTISRFLYIFLNHSFLQQKYSLIGAYL